MPFDDQAADRIRTALEDRTDVTEKKMFGGLCFLVGGNMAVGLTGHDDLMVRTGPDAHADALAQPHARPMDFTGRRMKGFVFVEPAGWDNKSKLAKWVDRGVDFASSLPAK